MRLDVIVGGLLLAAPVACGDRTLGGSGDTGSSSGAGTTTTGDTPTSSTDPSSPGTTATTVPGTTATTETTMPGTSATTTPGTSATTETTAPGTTSVGSTGPGTTTDGPDKFDVPSPLATVPDGIRSGCTQQPPVPSAIKGTSQLGQIVSKRAYFGYVSSFDELYNVRLLFLDDTADVDVAMTELANSSGNLSTGPALQVSPSLEFTADNPFWVGVDDKAVVLVVADGKAAEVPVSVTIDGHAGDWDKVVPGDPARLIGTLAPQGGQFQFSGEFDAVYCHLLTQDIIPE